MSLSKKNLDKLNNFVKNENLKNDNHIIQCKNIDKNHKKSSSSTKSDDPNKIFYSLIDNSETLNETSKVNHLLRKSEEEDINLNSRKTDYSTHLTIEDKLYDEFNYLLEE